MNTRNRHMQYRKSVYRKNRIKTVLLTVFSLLVILALFFVVVGNLLLGRNDTDSQSQTDSESHSSDSANSKTRFSVSASPVPLSADGSTLASRLQSLKNGGCTEVCFNMDTKSGELLYISPLASSLGRQSSGDGLRSLENIVGLFTSNGLYSIGITHISDFSSENDLERTAAIGYHAALIAEALRSGINDVLIYTEQTELSRYDELIALVVEVRRLTDSGSLGISLPLSVIPNTSDASAKELLARLDEQFDYIALDLCPLSEAQEDESALAMRIDAELSKTHLYLLQYNIRALIPSDDDDTVKVMLDALRAKDVTNSQIMP